MFSAVSLPCTSPHYPSHVENSLPGNCPVGTVDLISRDDLNEALTTLELEEPDTEILDKMFTMFDDTGENTVHYNQFLAALCLLTTAAPNTKLKYAFSLFDRKGGGSINRGDVKSCLFAMNNAVCFFGDPVVGEDEIAETLNECYKKGSDEGIVHMSDVKYEEFIPILIDSQLFFKFICALGTVRYVKSK